MSEPIKIKISLKELNKKKRALENEINAFIDEFKNDINYDPNNMGVSINKDELLQKHQLHIIFDKEKYDIIEDDNEHQNHQP